ncbi:MAG: hypothetical protein P8Y24_12250, partial [Gammaproteobacteria bacterium]
MEIYLKLQRKLNGSLALHGLSIFILALLAIVIYGQTAGFGLIAYDDDIYISQNPHFLDGFTIDNFIWSTSYFLNSNWSPVVIWSYILDAVIYGEWYGGYHISNLIIHFINGILLYVITFRLTSKHICSLLLAIFFIVHPQHVESV